MSCASENSQAGQGRARGGPAGGQAGLKQVLEQQTKIPHTGGTALRAFTLPVAKNTESKKLAERGEKN